MKSGSLRSLLCRSGTGAQTPPASLTPSADGDTGRVAQLTQGAETGAHSDQMTAQGLICHNTKKRQLVGHEQWKTPLKWGPQLVKGSPVGCDMLERPQGSLSLSQGDSAAMARLGIPDPTAKGQFTAGAEFHEGPQQRDEGTRQGDAGQIGSESLSPAGREAVECAVTRTRHEETAAAPNGRGEAGGR